MPFFHAIASRDCVVLGLMKRLASSRSRNDGDARLSSHSSTVFGCAESAAFHCHERWIWLDARDESARRIATLPPKRTIASTETSRREPITDVEGELGSYVADVIPLDGRRALVQLSRQTVDVAVAEPVR